MNDAQLLATLVHRGHLDRADAERMLPELKAGRPLDELLVSVVGWTEAQVRKMRRTDGGAIPEIPGYTDLRNVGTGGTADVFRAQETKTRRTVALKVLKPECTAVESVRKAFIAEARLLERLRHPGLVEGYGVARSGRTYFSRMEYVEGRTLLELLDAGEAFDEQRALQVVLEVARVLHYLEGEGVVHRDIKPGNIMIDRSGSVKLIDLGFAAEGEGAAAAGDDTTVGTVAYISPEQARGAAAADSRSDIYSLGVSLFHVVVGRLPFDSTDDRELIRMQVMEHLSSPELKSRGLSPHLHYFIEKMMAKEAGHRYQSWSELVADIGTQLEGRASLDFESDVRGSDPRGRRRRRSV